MHNVIFQLKLTKKNGACGGVMNIVDLTKKYPVPKRYRVFFG